VNAESIAVKNKAKKEIDYKEKAFNRLRKQNLRITNARKAIIDILEGRHLTIHEIYDELKLKGYHNLSTVYNNLDFLCDYKIITKVFINDKTYYDLAIEETSHDADSHIHVACQSSENIIELNEEKILEKIKNDPVFAGFDISKLQLIIEGTCKHESEMCKVKDTCYIKSIDKH